MANPLRENKNEKAYSLSN